MRGVLAVALTFLAGCASVPETSAGVHATAAREGDGLRVRFRLDRPARSPLAARVEADAGELDEVVRSADGRSLAVFWRRPAGELRCRFPRAGLGRWRADDPVAKTVVDYVFLEADGVRVTGRVPRGCPMRPELELDVQVDRALRPAALLFPGASVARPVREGSFRMAWRIPQDRHGVLRDGDYPFVLSTTDGNKRIFLVGIDPDGTPAATTGYIRNW